MKTAFLDHATKGKLDIPLPGVLLLAMASNSSSAAADPRDIEMSVQRGEGEWQPRDGSSSSGSGSGNAGTTTDEATSSDSSLNITSEDSLVEPQGGGVVAVANGRAGRGKSVCIDSLDELGLDDVPGHVVPGNGVDGTTNGGEGAAPAAPAVVSQGKARVIPVGERRTYCVGHRALTPTRPSSYLRIPQREEIHTHTLTPGPITSIFSYLHTSHSRL